MILYLDTLGSEAQIWLDQTASKRELGRKMSDELMGFVLDALAGAVPDGLVVHRDRGSFTGARLGAALANTLAEVYARPIVGASGDDWRAVGAARLAAGENDGLIEPVYD